MLYMYCSVIYFSFTNSRYLMFNCCRQKAIGSATLKLGNLSEVDNTCYNFKFPLEKRPLDKMFLLDKNVSRQNTSPFEIKKRTTKKNLIHITIKKEALFCRRANLQHAFNKG